MPALVAGIHAVGSNQHLKRTQASDLPESALMRPGMDGRDKPGQDGRGSLDEMCESDSRSRGGRSHAKSSAALLDAELQTVSPRRARDARLPAGGRRGLSGKGELNSDPPAYSAGVPGAGSLPHLAREV